MRRFLLSLVVLGFLAHFGAWGQTVDGTNGLAGSVMQMFGTKDPVYFQLYGGINKSANENLPWVELSRYPWSYGSFVGLGGEFNPILGWRMAFRYNHNKSRNVQQCESPETWGWNNVGAFADVTIDILDYYLMKTRAASLDDLAPSSKWDIKAFAGVGMAYTFGFDDVPLSYSHAYSRSSMLLPGFRVGATASYQVAYHYRIGAELSHSMFLDRFNGVRADFPMDGRTNLKVGLTYLVKKRRSVAGPKRREIPKEIDKDPLQYDTRLKFAPPLPMVKFDSEETKIRRIVGRAFLDFPVNETVIYPEYRRNPQELNRIIASVDSALFDANTIVTKISLHGYASPESPYSNNVRLSKGRVAALRDYLQNKYGFDKDLFVLNNTPEDWENLRAFVAESNRRRVKGDVWYESQSILETPEMPSEVLMYREELLRVIDLEMDEDSKELRLKKVGGGEPYKWLHKYVYPGLRHTDYIIEYIIRHFSVSEGRKMIYAHPEAMSLAEMSRVAYSYDEGSDEWLDAFLIAAKQYPDNELANLNAACACVRVVRLADAKKYLEKAGYSPQAKYVADVIKAMEGTASWKVVDGKVVIE